jgi:hypothetical protein
MVIASGALRRLAQAGLMVLPARLDRGLVALCALTLLIGLTHAFVPLFLDSRDLRNRLANLMEWYAAGSFMLFFFALAWLWWRTRFSAQFVHRMPS